MKEGWKDGWMDGGGKVQTNARRRRKPQTKENVTFAFASGWKSPQCKHTNLLEGANLLLELVL